MCDHREIYEDVSDGHVYCLGCKKTLEHKKFIEDSTSGDDVCTSCGLVLNTNYSFDSYTYDAYSRKAFEGRSKECYEIKNHLAVLFIDSQAIEQEAMNIFKEVSHKVKQVPNGKTTKRKKVHLAYSIWRALSIHRHPRSMDEIAQLCGVKEKHMLKVEKSLAIRQVFSPIVDYVERVVDTLQLPYWLNKIIRQILQSKQVVSIHKPVNIIAVILVHLCKIMHEEEIKDYEHNSSSLMYYMLDKNRDKSAKLMPKDWTINEISCKLNTNKGVLQRIMKKYNMKLIKNILESCSASKYYYY